jgi:hypothetical protein
MNALIRTIKLILLIRILHSRGSERSIKDMGGKNRTQFNVFDRVLTLQMKVCHSKMSM